MTNMSEYVRIAYDTNRLREPILRSALKVLQFPPGSQGLDAGCGIGLQALLLAEEIGPTGHVTGLDLSTESLDYAKGLVDREGFSERISFQEGDVNQLPFDDGFFDWAWSMDCVGYAPIEPLPLLKELARVVKPGGTIAILAWSSEKLLPGYPMLEALLNATSSGLAPFRIGMKPEIHFHRALGWFREAGLVESTARTITGDVFAPLSEAQRRAMKDLIQMRWSGVESELDQENWEEYKRLCTPESPDFILDHPDYYAFFTYSMFIGKVD